MNQDQDNREVTDSLLTTEEMNSSSTPGKISNINLAFTMMAASMGTGIFNLPLRVTEIGVLTFIFYIVIAAFFCYHGALYIAKLCKIFNFNSYGEMSNEAYGRPMRIFSQFVLILFPWGITICFQVILVKFIIQLGADVCGFDFYDDRDSEEYSTKGNVTRILLNLFVIVTDFLFIVQRDLGVVQKLTKVGVSIVTYNTLIVFLLLLFGFTRNVEPKLVYHGLFHLDWSKVSWVTFTGWQSFSQHVQALSSILFCYVNHQLVFFVMQNCKNPTMSNYKQIFRIVNIGSGSVYLLLGLSGYLLLIEHEDVEPIGAMVITSITSVPMTIGKFLMVFTLYFCVPLNMFPARQVFYEGLGIEPTKKNHLILSISMAGSSCLIAIAFQHVNSYFGLLGGTAGVMLGGGIPCLCYLKMVVAKQRREQLALKQDQQKQKVSPLAFDIVILIVSGIIIVFSMIGAILSIVDPS